MPRQVVSTYRVQLRPPAADHPGFTFTDAAAVVPYLAELGITTLYCSPYLQAAPGSAHGYDVEDHARLSEELGGEAAFAALVAACHAADLGIVLDVVPNHMAVSARNAAWWAVLRDGPASPYAGWFDIDWDSRDNPGTVLVPILGAPLGECLDQLELLEDRIRYYDHEVPIDPGTLVPGDVLATLAAQHYRLAHWRVAGEELNYRRFFDVTTLAGLRVEDETVFADAHRVVLKQVQTGVLDGLRIDHPDGLADPVGYLARLAEQTGDLWVVVEKILEPGEQLPADWRTAGTTGYDALNQVLGLFVDPAGEQPLTDLWTSRSGACASYDDVVAACKRLVLRDVLAAEVNRLTELGLRVCRIDPRLRDVTRRAFHVALVALLVAFPVYRAYLGPDGPPDDVAREHVAHAVAAARTALPSRADEIELVARLALAEGPKSPAAQEFVVRFQQTCGPVMAKGVEDTAFYRYFRLSALNEVGGDPARFGLSSSDFHAYCRQQQADWPATMTTLSTHDTKRSEDVRARLALLSQAPPAWGEAVTRWSALAARHRSAAGPDRGTEYLLWQTLVGAWPLPPDRAVAYLEKATREGKEHTSWVDPVPAFDQALAAYIRAVLADEAVVADISAYVESLAPAWADTLLAQKLVQLTMPGVADTYQGTELVDLSLVDPDNRRPVDYAERRALLDRLGRPPSPAAATGGGAPSAVESAAKLHLVTTVLRLRRNHPEWFLGEASYDGLVAGERALAFLRSGAVVTVVPTRSVSVRAVGWGDDTVQLPAGDWRNALTGAAISGGPVPLGELLAEFAVALLVRA